MGGTIRHRGPDGEGIWLAPHLGVALVHRRLAILDLSPTGQQPMLSVSGRYCIAFNGEIYNYKELRRAIEKEVAWTWRGTSDTEVLLACIDLWGVNNALRRVDGMYAIAIVDTHESQLTLARDRMGEKPLYFGWQRGCFLFGSELKALLAHSSADRVVDRIALAQYLRFGYVPAPRSIYDGIKKLSPGTLAIVELRSGAQTEVRTETHWELPRPDSSGDMDLEVAEQYLDQLLKEAVLSRMHSDVPLGAFLSGGVDSSLIAAIMQSQSTGRIRTFSIGFRESAEDESSFARQVASCLGTEHTELFVTPDDALGVIPLLPEVWDEPFADSSQIPTYLLAGLTRKHVTVALSGDGGDELFGGYVRYLQVRWLSTFYKLLPRLLRKSIAVPILAVSGSALDRILRLMPRELAVQFGAEKLRKMANAISARDISDYYRTVVAQWTDAEKLAGVAPASTLTVIDDDKLMESFHSPLDWMMYSDQKTYLPDDILVKVDRATMACSLEARVPFLAPSIIDFASRIPRDQKITGARGKVLLRRVLSRYIDPSLMDRPKQGFALPLATWLRGPLREWAESLLTQEALVQNGILNPEYVRQTWRDHVRGRRNGQSRLWTVLMLQAWAARFKPTM